MAAPAPRRATSPYARRLARERGVALELLTGSGPGGRIVAADVLSFAPPRPSPVAPAAASIRLSALATTIELGTVMQLLAGFADAESPFELVDLVLRAAGCALDDVPGASRLDGDPIGVERPGAQAVVAQIRKSSLAPLRQRRLAALQANLDQSGEAAAVSIRIIEASEIRPVLMPLLPGRAMRLVLATGPVSAECLLSFDADQVNEEDAAEFLRRFKRYLETPLLLLA